MRLIDSEKVHGYLIEYAYDHQHEFGFHWGDIIKFTPSQVSEILVKMPTIDAVPVIRCKDCKWFGEYGCAIRIVDESDKPKENDYCSFAERRSDDGV